MTPAELAERVAAIRKGHEASTHPEWRETTDIGVLLAALDAEREKGATAAGPGMEVDRLADATDLSSLLTALAVCAPSQEFLNGIQGRFSGAQCAVLLAALERAADIESILAAVTEDRDHCHATIREWVRRQDAGEPLDPRADLVAENAELRRERDAMRRRAERVEMHAWLHIRAIEAITRPNERLSPTAEGLRAALADAPAPGEKP